MNSPTHLGPYEIVRELGRGGQGVVWEGLDPRTGQRVAIKQLVDPSPEQLLRFQREGQLLARLREPGLVRVHGLIEPAPGGPALVMELVPGRPIGAADATRLGPAGAARIVAQVARTLAAMHAVGVLHRDLKPGNVLLDPRDQPVLVDLGLGTAEDVAALTRTGATLGTPGFMAPEQVRGEAIGPATDVFGLGGLLYFLLSGQSVNGGGPLMECLRRAAAGALDERPLRALAPELQRIVRAALAPDPARRPAASELADLLDRWRLGSARPAGLVGWLVAAGLAVLVAALLGSRAWRGEAHAVPSSADLAPPAAPLSSSVAAAAGSDAAPAAPAPLGPRLRTRPASPGGVERVWLSWEEEAEGEGGPRSLGWQLYARDRVMTDDGQTQRIDTRVLKVTAHLRTALGGPYEWPGPPESLLRPVSVIENEIFHREVQIGSGALLGVRGIDELQEKILAAIVARDEFSAGTVEVVARSLGRRLPDCLELVHHLSPGPGDPGPTWTVISRDDQGQARYVRRFEVRGADRLSFSLSSCAADEAPVPPVLRIRDQGVPTPVLRGSVRLGPGGVEEVEAEQELRAGHELRRSRVRWTWERR